MRRGILALSAVLLLGVQPVPAGEIGFVEDYSLAPDRSALLKQLIPGTEDYYFYHCLNYQLTGEFDKVRDMLNLWTKRYGETAQVKETRNRLALLTYSKDPQATLARIRTELSLRFDHQRQRLDRTLDVNHPTVLDQKVIDWTVLRDRAFARSPNTVAQFEDTALDQLLRENLDANRRRDLLRRLSRPDYPNLVDLVMADLRYKDNGGFGYLPIHRQLLLPQLAACLENMPELLRDSPFINAYLARLRPGADVEWENDPAERKAFLDRMWDFVRRLPPAHNSLKAHVLFGRLELDRGQDIFNKDLFLEYLRLPRNVFYVNRDYLKKADNNRFLAELGADYRNVTTLSPIGSDEPLVRDYLEHFLVNAPDTAEFAEYIESAYLKECFAETKIVNGVGDMEQWYSLLSPDKYNALKERVDLQFLPSNPRVYGLTDRVALRAAVKNVSTLIVKLYRINTFNYYKANLRELNTGIDLDGLVANEEKVLEYKQVPLRRHVETFDFANLDKPGVYVVELIGNGISSRALIHKGRLTLAGRAGSAGHVFSIFDENNRKLPDATLWLAGKEYKADDKGEIAIPFSNRPGRQKVILSHRDFAALAEFDHLAENYTLEAGIHADLESLLADRICKVIIRPALSLNDIPVDVGLLEEVTLTVRCTDNEGISTSREIKDFKLQNDRDSVHEFKVPEKLAQVTFALSARVENLSQAKKIDLAAARTIDVNAIDKTDRIESLHLRHVAGGYLLEVLGKSGEPRADRPVHVELKHRDFRETVHATLQSDANGNVVLGPLAGIDWIRANGPENTRFAWNIRPDRHTYTPDIHGLVGKPVLIPFMGKPSDPKLETLSLLEVRDGAFVRDLRDSVTLKDGFIVIDDLPAGDYSLLIKESQTPITLRITKGIREGSMLLSRDRMLEVRDLAPLQIAGVDVNPKAGTVGIRLLNASPAARVHLVAARFMTAEDPFENIGAPDWPTLTQGAVDRPLSLYVSGRNIGDEYRYILERKYALRFPGNMLKKPSILLNPWSLRKTEQGEEAAKAGESWSDQAEQLKRYGGARKKAQSRLGGATGADSGASFANLDFLPETSRVLPNLVPDANGLVMVKIADLGPRQQLHIVAVDDTGAAYREIALPGAPEKFRDLRLARSLDVARHYTEQKKISTVAAGATFTVPDITTSQVEVYDTLGKVYSLFATLNPDPQLIEFGFILGWPDLKPEKKHELYSRYACHELSFFLSRKDPKFFETVIQPYLKNKKDKTFIDQWLLGADLSAYRQPWAYARLNVPERILLAQRIKAEPAPTARHIRDLYDLVTPDIERFNHLFKTALKGSAMEMASLLPGDLGGAKDKFAELDAAEPMAKKGLARGAGGAAMRNAGFAAAPPAPSGAKPASAPAEQMKAMAMMDRAKEEKAAEYEGRELAGKADRARRASVRQFYRKLDKTEEWVENNYYHLPIEQQLADLVPVNGFWKDYAAHDGRGPFLSAGMAEASRNFTEMMLALAVLDLPFTAANHESRLTERQLALKAASPAIVYHRETREAPDADKSRPILVSQNFFARDDRYRHEGNERFDKFVTEEFLPHRVYGSQIVLTNPTSSRRKVDVLLQIPQGAVPVANGFYTRSIHMQLEPYSTSTAEYYFYFPFTGAFSHYPVHVAQDEKVLGYTAPFTFNVVEKLTKLDTTSWQYVSQNGTDKEVIAYLRDNNIDWLDLGLIAFRMRNVDFFRQAIPLLQARHVYDGTLWSYGVQHNDVPAIREFLRHSAFALQCGPVLDSPLLTLDPVERHAYQHREYWPLVNPRVYRLGRKRDILNHQFYAQYNDWLNTLRYRAKLTDMDRMVTTVYLLLQDRVDEAIRFFDTIDPKAVEPAMQYDYLQAYIAFCREKPADARRVARKYEDHPVDRWRFLFRDIIAQADEIEGKSPAVIDKEDRTQVQSSLAGSEAGFDFKVEDRRITLNYQNMERCTVNYYLMDIELLFSRNPFVQEVSGQFSVIQPNRSAALDLPAKKNSLVFDLPAEFKDSNVMIEISSGGITRTQAYYPHSLNIQVLESYGQVKVADLKSQKPLSKVYVKVFARMKNGQVQFFKDGYTDLRGRFDYTSLNTNEIENVQKFSILVMSEANGSVVREANPPKM